MSKGLEALNWLNHQARCGYVDEITQRIIKDKTETIEKEVKALEIIKRQPYEVVASIYEFDSYKEMLEEWWLFSGNKCPFKNEEEYKLVKEVLS